MESPDPSDEGQGTRQYPPYLRLAWSNPLPPRSRSRVDLARAIERHLSGVDGLSREQFLALYSGRAGLRPY